MPLRPPSSPKSPVRVPLLLTLVALCALLSSARAAERTDRAEAITAVQEGRYEDALALLPATLAEPELSYLAARCLAELGRFDEAIARLPEPPASWPERIRSDVLAQRMHWSAEAGRCLDVEGMAALQGGKGDARITRFLARCAFRANDFAKARTLLEQPKDAEGRAMLVRSLFALGEKEEALTRARAFLISEPAHADAEAVQQLAVAADPLFALTVSEQLDRAEALIAARRSEQAIAALDALPKQRERPLEARRHHLRGDALFRMRTRYPDAAKAFAQAAALAGATEAYDAFHAIRATSRAGQDGAAIKRYRAFAKQYPKSSFAADAVYLAAWLSARGNQKGAREELARFASSELAKQNKGLLRDAEWDLGWLALKQRDYAGVTQWLGRYERDALSDMERARAAYWQGRSARRAGKKSVAIECFLRAMQAERLGYYAQLSVRELRALGEAIPEPFDAAAAPPAPGKPPALPEAAFYAALGLSADASRMAEAALPQAADRASRVLALSATGDDAKTFVAASPLLNPALTAGPEAAQWLWEALFPRPYLPLVQQHTTQHRIEPTLFYGHMQIESRYRPEVVSGADAIGLMQLLPSTAAKVAKRLNLPATRAALKRPYVNIALGAAFLGHLLERYKGQEPLAIAAYNAGESRVDEWVKRTGRVELAHWVEEIPVEQTRNYVRRVIGAWARYRAAEQPSTAWDIPLPTLVGPSRE